MTYLEHQKFRDGDQRYRDVSGADLPDFRPPMRWLDSYKLRATQSTIHPLIGWKMPQLQDEK